MESNTKNKALTSVFWKFAERIIAQTISLVVSIILARILTPEDYSVVGIVTIFFSFSNILISGGLNTALIQKKDADTKDYSTVFHISVIFSVLIYICLFLLAPIISKMYNKPVLIAVIRVMGLILPINAVKSIWCAYISSHLQFKKFFFATIVGTIISAFVGIFMATNGFGVWALVAQQMTNSFIDTLMLVFLTRIHIAPKVSFERLKKLFGYGWKVLLASLLGTVYSEINPLFIGLKYSTADLSYYTKGRSFPFLISSTATNTLSAVLFPVLAKNQDDKEALLSYTRMFVRLASYIAFPLMIGFFSVADKFIGVVLTDKWLPAVPYVRIFCISCMFDMIHIGNCETIKAMGRSDVYLIMEFAKKTGYFIVIGCFLMFSNSPITLALSFIICTLIAVVVNSIPNQKLINYKYSYQIKDLLPNLLSAIVMGLAVYFVGKLRINEILLLILQILFGGAVYILLSILTKNKCFWYIYLNVLKRKDKVI